MEIQDFQYMRCGKFVRALYPEDASLLKTIEKTRNKKHDKALLLLHGFSSSPAVFRLMLPKITKYDTIIAPVLPGHGESIPAFAKIKASAWVNNSMRWAETLCATYKKVDVLGLSLGGLLAYKIAQNFELNHLYLLAPAFALKRYNVNVLKFLVKVVKALGLQALPNKAGDLYTNLHAELAYKRLPLSVVYEILNLISGFQWQAPNCDTDIFLGEYDYVIDSKRLSKICANSNNTKIHLLKNSAHVLPLDGDVEYLLNCVNDS